MEHNYNIILEEIRKLINKSAILLLSFMIALSLFIGILCTAGILPLAALWTFCGIVPTAVALAFAVICLHKKADAFYKRQQISMMAFHAKQAIDTFRQEFPDSFVSDCHIRMRYLARNGVNVDNALKDLTETLTHTISLCFLF